MQIETCSRTVYGSNYVENEYYSLSNLNKSFILFDLCCHQWLVSCLCHMLCQSFCACLDYVFCWLLLFCVRAHCTTRPFFMIHVPFQRYLRFSYTLGILKREKVCVVIRNFRVPASITVAVSATVLLFTESRSSYAWLYETYFLWIFEMSSLLNFSRLK